MNLPVFVSTDTRALAKPPTQRRTRVEFFLPRYTAGDRVIAKNFLSQPLPDFPCGCKSRSIGEPMDQLAQHLEPVPESPVLQFPDAGPPLLILHIDDDTRDHMLLKTASRDANVPISWQHVDSARGAISYLQRLLKTNPPDLWPNLILLDIAMPGENGLKVLEYTCAKPEFHKLPIIVFSGSKDPKVTARAGLLGAKSVIAKPSNFEEAVELIGSVYRLFSLSMKRTTGSRL